MCEIAFEKAKGRGGMENRASVFVEATGRFFKKGELSQNSQEIICAGLSFLIKLNSVDLQVH